MNLTKARCIILFGVQRPAETIRPVWKAIKIQPYE